MIVSSTALLFNRRWSKYDNTLDQEYYLLLLKKVVQCIRNWQLLTQTSVVWNSSQQQQSGVLLTIEKYHIIHKLVKSKLYAAMKEASSIYYPPGPVHKLPLSLFLHFLRNPIEVLNNISKYGDISHFNGTQLVYFLNRPDYIRDVLVTYNNNFIKGRGVQLAKKVLGDGLLTSEGNIHRESNGN